MIDLTDQQMADIDTPEGMKQRLASAVSHALHGGDADGFEVWHTESQPTATTVDVHDFTYTHGDVTWRGSFRLTLDRIDAWVDAADDIEDYEEDWYDEFDDEEDED